MSTLFNIDTLRNIYAKDNFHNAKANNYAADYSYTTQADFYVCTSITKAVIYVQGFLPSSSTNDYVESFIPSFFFFSTTQTNKHLHET